MKNSVTVELAGKSFRMTTDADADHIKALAERINARIDELCPGGQRSASAAQLLAVVALSLADDLELSEHRRERLMSSTRTAVSEAIRRIDQRLALSARSE